MKKSLLSVILLFITWAVSATAISSPMAIVRLKDADSPHSRVHRSFAEVCPVRMQPKMCLSRHRFQPSGIGVLPHATRLITPPEYTSTKPGDPNKTTGIEFSLFQTGIEGDKGLNFISTSHREKNDFSGALLFRDQLQFGYTIRLWVHNHPSGSLQFSDNDKKSFSELREKKWFFGLSVYANGKKIYY